MFSALKLVLPQLVPHQSKVIGQSSLMSYSAAAYWWSRVQRFSRSAFDGEVQYLVAILPPHIEFLTQLNEFVVYVMVDQGPKAE